MYAAPHLNSTTNSAETVYMVWDDGTARRCDSHAQRQPGPSANTLNPIASSHGQSAFDSKSTWSADSNVLFVDVEGFQINADFYIKELAFFQP